MSNTDRVAGSADIPVGENAPENSFRKIVASRASGSVADRNVRAPLPQVERSWRRRLFICALTALAAFLLVASLKLPLWHMRLEAPQYRDQEALRIAVHPNALRGDLKELATLDQYIGVHVPATLPQFRWLPQALMAGALLGVLAALLRQPLRPTALTLVSCALAAALAWAAIQAMGQIRDIGHKRDQKTVLVGIRDFTPPFLGTAKIAQFTVRSGFGIGAWLIGSALGLQLGAAWLSRQKRPVEAPAAPRARACSSLPAALVLPHGGEPSRVAALEMEGRRKS